METTTTTEHDQAIQGILDQIEQVAESRCLHELESKALRSHAPLIGGLLDTFEPPAPEAHRELVDRWFLYTLPSGEQRVYEVTSFDDEERGGGYDVFLVTDKPVYDSNERGVIEDLPEDYATAGEEITEERAKEITGYYRDGQSLVDQAWCALDRVRPGDPYEPFCRALVKMIEGTPVGEW
jgi:hypothetical protein